MGRPYTKEKESMQHGGDKVKAGFSWAAMFMAELEHYYRSQMERI